MRIIAGEFRGRALASPAGHRIRPTADRVREAWLNIVEPALADAVVLDLFAGSGALGLEALSRGAGHADIVDNSRASLAAIRANVGSLGVQHRATVHRRDALKFAERSAERAYDVAFADPPYDTDYPERLIRSFRSKPFARLLGIEHSAAARLDGDDMRLYGDAAITFCYAP